MSHDFSAYLVGGAVRDQLLGQPVKDRDWVVVGATPAMLKSQGYRQVGKDFPVFLHPQTHEEFALARTERKTAPGHTGFETNFSPSVTLEQDLLRRDLTINAMAQTAEGELIDPYHGKADLDARILRHVSPAFVEDPLRVLRVARFAARLAAYEFTVAPETMALMQTISQSGELQTLPAERIWTEVSSALQTDAPQLFFSLLRECHALPAIMPELEALFGVPQPEQHHPEIDTGLHSLLALEQAAKLTTDVPVRYAALVHDVGKAATDPSHWPSHPGHESQGLALLDQLSERLRPPREHAELARLACAHHTKLHRVFDLKPGTLLQLILALDGLRRPERLDQFVLACEADARGRTGFEQRDYPQADYLREMRDSLRAIDSEGVIKSAPDKTPQQAIEDARLACLTAAKRAFKEQKDVH